MRKNSLWGLALAVICLVAVLFVVEWKLEWQRQGLLRFVMLDVGQGDSILIETPDGSRVLIDGGSGDKVLSELAEVSGFLTQNIDYVIVTHSDADHFEGLFKVAEHYDPRAYYLNIPTGNKKALEEWWPERSIGFTAGSLLTLGEVEIKALWPEVPDGESEVQFKADRNLSSIVVRVEYKDFCGILTGDAPIDVESQLVEEYGQELDCELLKVGHHGSSGSSSVEFLEAVSPDVALISVGEGNRYGHPSAEVLERLLRVKAVIFRTDEDGRIEIWTDGEYVYW